jgi:SAM-dependent methyltransferase
MKSGILIPHSLKRITRALIKRPFFKLLLFLNKIGRKRCCYICRNTFQKFDKYKDGLKGQPSFRQMLNPVGSDVDNFGCPYCKAHDRERHLFMYFDKLDFWTKMRNADILHLAPEKHLSEKINKLNPNSYIRGDLNPQKQDVVLIDATNIQYNNESFDIVICNHVLEHIPYYLKAIAEIYRVLKWNGTAILQTPYSKLLKTNFADEGINTDELRSFFYGEKDHYRIFSEAHFKKDLVEKGFKLDIVKNSDLFSERESYYYGVNSKEDLIIITKM